MTRITGTQVFGLRTPIIREGVNLEQIVVDTLRSASDRGIRLRDGDVVGVTEAVVARAQGNYATVDQIAKAVRARFASGAVGALFPILSRNRFSILLKGIARGADRVIVQLSYPDDEVGNELVERSRVEEAGLDPRVDVLTEADFRDHFGARTPHRFTGVDYIDFYKTLGPNIELILANDPRAIRSYAAQAVVCDIHTRARTRKKLEALGGVDVCGLDELLARPVDGSGCNPQFGLLGSNKAGEERVKLFPRDGQAFVDSLRRAIAAELGVTMEVLIYGDGGFKDPVGGIWELADPVICPAYTKGLEGTPNEIKLKYLADNEFGHLDAPAQQTAVRKAIRAKNRDLMGKMESEGTTPRRLTDLLGSLCDLTSGSGDKGTPVVLIQGYFDNFANEEG